VATARFQACSSGKTSQGISVREIKSVVAAKLPRG
jgi:hypothetical protein